MSEDGKRMALASRLAGLVALTALLPACQLEQVMIGQYYTVPTPGIGACPALSWTFVVDPARHIAGHVSAGNQVTVARLSGTLNADDTYQMTKTDTASGRTAEVSGQFSTTMATFTISGRDDPCDGRTFRVRFLYSPFLSGGGGGG